MRRWNEWMLKTKMFVTFSVVFLSIVLLTCFILYYKNASDIKMQTKALSSTTTKQFSRTVELYIHEMEQLSISIFGDPVVQSSLLDHYKIVDPVEQNRIELNLTSRLYMLMHPQPHVQSIYLMALDKYSYYVSRTNGPKLYSSLEDEPWYAAGKRSLATNKFLLLPTVYENQSDYESPKVISFIRAINRVPTRNTIAYLKININVKLFKDMLVHSDSNDIERQMRVFILTDDGHIVYDNRDELTGSTDARIGTSIAASNSSNSSELTWNGKTYLYTLQKSAYTGWNTMILIPNDLLLTKLRHSQYILLLAGLIAMLLIAVVSYLLSHHITIPLLYMMKKMSRVEQGDFRERMEVRGNNEISRLSRIYNEMLDSITRLINEVYQSKLAEKNAQLSALQAQINPHFLYNTLNIMKSISRLKGIEEVAEMSEALADLFQYSMKNVQHPVTLQEEVEHIRSYMKIQQHRFLDRFEVSCEVPEPLLQASILKLTIQPLIENAINHGLSKMRTGGSIKLTAARNEDLLVIEVTDNGAGFEERERRELEAKLQAPGSYLEQHTQTHGIGLLNIQQRIHLLYGDKYGMKVISQPGKGTTVRLEFPYLTHVKREGDGEA